MLDEYKLLNKSYSGLANSYCKEIFKSSQTFKNMEIKYQYFEKVNGTWCNFVQKHFKAILME